MTVHSKVILDKCACVRVCVRACVRVCVLYALNLEIVRQNRVYLHPVGCADLWGAGRTGSCRKG